MHHPSPLEVVFFAALEQGSPEERAAYLDEACAGDADLRRRVEKMLAAQAQAGSFLEHPARSPVETIDEQLIGEGPGAVIGLYKLLEPIGEGGFGVVYLAEQTEPIRRKVALKALKPGMDTRQVVARFEAERQALAIMDHPNIAKVFDGGATPSGRPYFVMELVKGVPITEFCDQSRLTLRQRLELFLAVCQAVQHAHQKGVIHRDLKPSNVLVTRHDTTPVVKVIDFGVAKALGQVLTDKTLFTGVAQMIGTPLYMSPEQAGMSDLDVDTRSDVYSLGVLLYELLTGTTPFTRERFQNAGYEEIRRIIREEEPPRPSTRLSESKDTLASISAQRQTEPVKLTRLMRGELDWIVMMALEKDRNRRYESASAFAADVQRYLHDEVVKARPPSVGYRFGKFIRRYKGRLAAAVALAVALLTGGAAVIAVQARADRDRAADRAAREAGTTASVAAATREARLRADEAWDLHDDPERMQRATDAAVASMRRADDFAAHGAPTAATLDELASTRKLIDELARHTHLIAAYAASREQFADEQNVDNFKATANVYNRHDEALRKFGLDPISGPVDEVVRAVADSRIRDSLLGMLTEWQSYAATLQAAREPGLRVSPRVAWARLGQVIGSARRRCGAAYARWQELLDRTDVPGLVAFAAADGLSFRSTLVAAVGRDLLRANQHTACRTFLRAAVDRYPHDVWLHYDLFQVCRAMRPPNFTEALRHISAASVQRPRSALFHLYVGDCYSALRSPDQAVAAYRKAIALGADSYFAHGRLGGELLGTKDWDGAAAAFREAMRIRSDEVRAHRGLVSALAGAGRYAEALEAARVVFRLYPAWAEDPRSYFRYDAACAAMNCADGKGVNAPPPAKRPAYRKEALDFLTVELAAFQKLAARERTTVHQLMQHWLQDEDLASVREPASLAALPPDERDAWNKLWADVRDLHGRTSPPEPKK
jgi:serine/threonine protein kinase/tetratricopeptide (TPR) repeat protein